MQWLRTALAQKLVGGSDETAETAGTQQLQASLAEAGLEEVWHDAASDAEEESARGGTEQPASAPAAESGAVRDGAAREVSVCAHWEHAWLLMPPLEPPAQAPTR